VYLYVCISLRIDKYDDADKDLCYHHHHYSHRHHLIATTTIIFNIISVIAVVFMVSHVFNFRRVAGHFSINQLVVLYFSICNTFRKISFSFWSVYFLRDFVMMDVRQIQYCTASEDN